MSDSLRPQDCSPPGSSVHGILQARIPEWVAMPSSRVSSWLRNQTHVSCFSCISMQTPLVPHASSSLQWPVTSRFSVLLGNRLGLCTFLSLLGFHCPGALWWVKCFFWQTTTTTAKNRCMNVVIGESFKPRLTRRFTFYFGEQLRKNDSQCRTIIHSVQLH